MTDDKRLIEDYLPIVAISAEQSGEIDQKRPHLHAASLVGTSTSRRMPGSRLRGSGSRVPVRAQRWV